MTGRDRYQRKALDCVREAERLRDPGERTKLLEIAGLYACLARHVSGRHGHGAAHRLSERDPEHPNDA